MTAIKLLNIERLVCVVLIAVNVLMLVMGLMSGDMGSLVMPIIGIVVLALLYVLLCKQMSKVKRLQQEAMEKNRNENNG
ncbi:MAG: hypothetical protein ACI308_04580 [Muribaculaceae bacterium]